MPSWLTRQSNKELELTPKLAGGSGECLRRRSAQSDAAAQLNSMLWIIDGRSGLYSRAYLRGLFFAMEYTHVSFSDESNWNVGRYRSIGMLSAPREAALNLHEVVASKLLQSGIDELKWNKLRNAKYRFAATKVLDCCAPCLADGIMRVDALVWDSQDSRHRVPNPDPVVNLQIMYFHLFRNAMSRRWPASSIWRHIPDEQTGLDWSSVRNFLSGKAAASVAELGLSEDMAEDEPFRSSLRRLFRVYEITPCTSKQMCLAQVADLFAGLAAFSRETWRDYGDWKATREYATMLLGHPKARTAGIEEKYGALLHLEQCIARTGLQVQMIPGGLRTLDPSVSLNFWWYEPKSVHDKAHSKVSADHSG